MILGGASQGSGDAKHRWKAQRRVFGASFLRLRTRFDDEGIEGLRDRRIGRVSGRRVADSEVERITALYRDRYRGFTVRYSHEFAVARHHLSQGYT